MEFFAVDTETTGLHAPYPIEIAAVKVYDLTQSFCERIRCVKEIEPGAQAIHGISQQDLQRCRSERDVLLDFLKFLGPGPYVLIAHNAKFDKGVIDQALKRQGLGFPDGTQWICTWEMSRQRLPKAKHSLVACCERAHIPYEHGHSALPDATMCARVYLDFLKDDEYAAGLAAVNQAEHEKDALNT